MYPRKIKQEAISVINDTKPFMVRDTFYRLIQPEKIAAYYTDQRDAFKFIGFPMYVVRSNLGIRHCQNDAIAREFIAEILEQKGFYGYYVYHSPERIERVEFWLPPPPPPVLAQK